MELKPEQLTGHLANGPLRPAYLIAGPEPLRVLEAADAVRAAARAQGVTEREVFEAEGQREPDWNALQASFRAPGLFSSKRLIELRLPSGKPGKEGAAVLAEFCDDPPADVTLMVVAGDWSMKQHGGKWSDAIGRVGVVSVCWAVKPHELAGWIERRLRSHGIAADSAAVQVLADRVEGNLLAAAQEVDKLALLSDGQPLDAARMQALVADAARFDVFRLLDSAMNGQGMQVSRMLAGLRAEGVAVPALLGMVVMELQRCAALAQAAAGGGNMAAEFKAQRIWDSKQAVYRRALQRHDARRWEAFVAQAGRVDRIAKGRGRPGHDPADAWSALERLLLAVADPKATRLLAGAGRA